MEKLKKYQKQIVTLITIFLLVTFGIYPGLTMANTFINIISGIGALLLIVWGLLEVKSAFDREDTEEQFFNQKWKEHVQKQIDEMKKMNAENESLKKKSNPKQFDGTKSSETFVKTRKKSTTKKTK